jgi:hypothetical protein
MDPRVEIVNSYVSGSNIYQIPVFQRDYEWNEEKWLYLWNDIKELYNSAVYNMKKDSNLTIENALKNRTHFIGTILSRSISPLGGGLGHSYTIIDGQQRLITLFIILSAIRDEEIGQFGNVSEDNSLSFATGKNKHPRITVNRTDAKLFGKIVEGKCKNGISSSDFESLLGKAYLFFRYQLMLGTNVRSESEDDLIDIRPPKPSRRKGAPAPGDFLKYWPPISGANKYNLELLQNCINYGLSILEIVLEEDDEEDAIIFETINAKSTPLEKFDLIRNSFFLRLGDQAEGFFKSEWLAFQNKLDLFRKPNNQKVSRDQFLYDYLIFKGQDKVSAARLYNKWLAFVSREMGQTGGDKDGGYFLEVIARPMLTTASIYPPSWGSTSTIAFENFRKTIRPEVSKVITEIISVTSGPTIPLHMLGLNAWMKEELTDDEVLIWFKKIQSLILRLVIAGEGLTTVRASVLAAAPSISKNVTINHLTKLIRESFRQPKDADLKNLVPTSQVAVDANAPAMAVVLRGIERQMRKTSAHPIQTGVGPSDWQIEHIYPQSENGPGPEWIRDLKSWGVEPENYNQLKFTLGNITALSSRDNQLAGRESFKTKQDIFKSTHLGISEDLLNLRHWKPKNIQGRSSYLLSHFIQEWPE